MPPPTASIARRNCGRRACTCASRSGAGSRPATATTPTSPRDWIFGDARAGAAGEATGGDSGTLADLEEDEGICVVITTSDVECFVLEQSATVDPENGLPLRGVEGCVPTRAARNPRQQLAMAIQPRSRGNGDRDQPGWARTRALANVFIKRLCQSRKYNGAR